MAQARNSDIPWVVRAWEDYYGGPPVLEGPHYITPQQFGAVGDGVADDTAAVQAALNASRRVFFPVGTYLVTTSLKTQWGQVIEGANWFDTKIIGPALTVPMFADQAGVGVFRGLTIRNIKLIGNPASPANHLFSADVSYGMRNCLFDRVWFHTCGGDAIHVNADLAAGKGGAYFNEVRGCIFGSPHTSDGETYANDRVFFYSRYASINIGTNILTSLTDAFTADCVGRTAYVHLAGAGGTMLVSVVTQFDNTKQILIADNAAGTVANTTTYVFTPGWSTILGYAIYGYGSCNQWNIHDNTFGQIEKDCIYVEGISTATLGGWNIHDNDFEGNHTGVVAPRYGVHAVGYVSKITAHHNWVEALGAWDDTYESGFFFAEFENATDLGHIVVTDNVLHAMAKSIKLSRISAGVIEGNRFSYAGYLPPAAAKQYHINVVSFNAGAQNLRIGENDYVDGTYPQLNLAAGTAEHVNQMYIQVVATGALPAAGSALNGLILIEDAGSGDQNLVIYSNSQRFRFDGGSPFVSPVLVSPGTLTLTGQQPTVAVA